MNLRPIPARKVIKLLNKIGFEVVRQRGSHVILKHPDGRLTHRGAQIFRSVSFIGVCVRL